MRKANSMMNPGIYSAVVGDNSDLIVRVVSLYTKDGYKIADVTFGKGVFWRKVDLSRFDFHASDILTCPKAKYDFRKLPYPSVSFDVVVLDPPYAHNPGQMLSDKNWKSVV